MAELNENKYIEILGGITSRLTVLASLLEHGFDKKYQLIWDDKQPGCNCNFNDLFVNKLTFCPKNTVDLEKPNVQTYGSKFEVFEYHQSILPPNVEAKNVINENFILRDDTNYIIMDFPVNHEHEFEFGRYFKTLMKRLVINSELQSIINKYLLEFNQFTYGVYYRGCKHTVNYLHDDAEHKSINHIIETVLNENIENKVFIATGDQKVIDGIQDFDQNRLIYIKEKEYVLDAGYSVKGVQRALMDWILVSKTKQIYANPACGYINKAAMQSNINVVPY